MIGETGHLCNVSTTTIVALCKCYSEYLSGYNGIFTVGFVEVATTKQQQGIRMLSLERIELFHHWG